MRKLSTKDLTLAAMVAAVYTVLTVFLPIPQYGEVQFRIAECMTVLPFLFPWATPGLIVGCFLANLLGSPFVLDWVFGTLATALACFMTARMPNKWLAPLPPVLCNAIIVGAEIAYSAVGGFGGAFWAAVVRGPWRAGGVLYPGPAPAGPAAQGGGLPRPYPGKAYFYPVKHRKTI